MATNLSKYIQINDFLLLEYGFNKDGSTLNQLLFCASTNKNSNTQTIQVFNPNGLGNTNNTYLLNSVPINNSRSFWYCSSTGMEIPNKFDSSIYISIPYQYDTLRIHMVSGYNFDDISGFLLQVRADSSTNGLVDLSNFTWIKQVIGNTVLKFSTNTLLLGNRFYDKYVEFKVPSVQQLGGDVGTLGQILKINALSDVYITYSTISEMDVDTYIISETISLQLPVSSNADDFNCLIAESTGGDFIEFYATFKDLIIGEYMGEIEQGRIPLYTSNNPNDNYQDFSDQYGVGTAKWVLIHELQVWEQFPGANILTQKYAFTQEDNFMLPNTFRPVLRNADIDSTYSLIYICRLMNRMDGTQIIRRASFSSTNPKKYGLYFTRINVDNYIPYKVFNRLAAEASPNVGGSGAQRTKFVKIYYDSVDVMLNMNNEVLPQGTGPLFLKQSDGLYLFKFNKVDINAGNQSVNVDLSGAYNYALIFVLDNQTKIEIGPTFSANMNTTLGQLEFKILESQAQILLSQTGNSYSIIVKNSDGTQYTFYQGIYYSYKDFNQVIAQFRSLFDVTSLNTQISALQTENRILSNQISTLKIK